MGELIILTGYIRAFDPHSNAPVSEIIRKHNIEVINSLPVEDTYPPLTLSMFAIIGPKPTHGTFRERVFPFGGTIKDLPTHNWEAWRTKFEKLLSQMYWYDAELWMRGGYMGGPKYCKWEIDDDSVSAVQSDPPQLPRKWTFLSE